MIGKDDFDGGLVYGPKTFAEKTGRNKVWAQPEAPILVTGPRDCPLCGSSKRELLFRTPEKAGKYQWDYHRCLGCKMVYTVYAPSEADLDRIYKTAPAQQAWVQLQQNSIELELDRKKFRWALEKIGWPFGKQNPSILDIGCSTGTLMEVAGEMTGDVPAVLIGVEINPEAQGVALKRLQLNNLRTVGLGDSLDWIAESRRKKGFDLVVLWEVLEHLFDPQAMLSRAAKMVAPGGKMLICVPNADALAVKVLHEKAPCFGLGHLNFYNEKTLGSAIAKALSGHRWSASYETIVSWSRELANWFALGDPMGADGVARNDFLLPNEIHSELEGYKLVAFVEEQKP